MGKTANKIETDVDVLVSLVKQKGTISIDNAAKALKLDVSTIQKWIDFLVEDEVLGIEYKFVTPFLYFNKDKEEQPTVLEESEGEYLEDKEEFVKKCERRGLGKNQTIKLWKNYLRINMDEIKNHFYRRAMSKNISEAKIDSLWNKYKESLYEGLQ